MQPDEKPNTSIIDPKDNFKNLHLAVDGQIILHTRLAQSLFNGSWKHGKMGLVQFARLMTTISKASREDDPYADWYLLKSYQALFDVREKLRTVELKLSDHFSSLRGIHINLLADKNLMHFPLQFSTPFGFMGAYLLADVDYVLRQLVTLQHIGVVLKEEITVKQLVRYLQEAFALPRYWRATGTTRPDVLANTEKYQQAKVLMGEVPKAVLNNEIEFSFMPKKNKR